MEADVKYNLDLIEYKIKDKFEQSMYWLNCLREALSRDNPSPDWIKKCEQYLGAELCCSIQATEQLDDPDDVPRYMYTKEGACSFKIDGVEFEVADLRSMREDPSINKARYFDICCVVCDYHHDDDDPGIMQYEFVPDAWLFGSTTCEFDKYKPVDSAFIRCCKKFIEEHGGAEKLCKAQEVHDEN